MQIIAFMLSVLLLLQSGQDRPIAAEQTIEPPVSTSRLALPFKKAWQYLTDSASPFPPAVDDSRIFLPLAGGQMLCLNRETGDLLWSSELGGIISAPPVAGEKALFVAARKLGADGADAGASLRAMDKATGLTLWARDYPRPFASMTVAKERIYAGCDDGALYALSPVGEAVWKAQTQDRVRGLPLAVGQTVYFGSDDGALRAIEAESGREAWKFQTGAKISGQPAIDDRSIYFGSGDGFVYAIDLATRKLRWRSRTGAAIEAAVALAGKMLIAASFDNFVYALSCKRGNRIWKKRLEGRIAAAPIVEGDATLIAPLRSEYAAVLFNPDGRPVGFFRLDKGMEIVARPVLMGDMLAVATDKGLVVARRASKEATAVR
ncbi:MAG: PQQ-binding-like beta-propeller repeat protein [Acidobacteriota bacterium]